VTLDRRYAVSSLGLGPIQLLISLGNGIGRRIDFIAFQGHDPETDRHATRGGGTVVPDLQCLHFGADLLRHRYGTGAIGFRQNSSELFAAIAGGQVLNSVDVFAEHTGNLLQAIVPGNVAIAVVECLEMIDVQNQERQQLP